MRVVCRRPPYSFFIDTADDECQQMLSIESVNVQTPVCMEAGEAWQGVQKITVVDV